MAVPEPEELRELGERLDKARQCERGRTVRSPPTLFGMAFRFSTELVLALAVGAAMGWGLDWLLGTRPVFIVLMSAIGGAAGIRNVMRAAREMNEQASRGPPPPPAPDDED
ncbi:MAG: AtpZ/AtpI family protein [Alphaproteobacteria bacterium]